MQYDHKQHKAALEFLSEKFDLPIPKVIDALDKNGMGAEPLRGPAFNAFSESLPPLGGRAFNMRDEYQSLTGFAYEPPRYRLTDITNEYPHKQFCDTDPVQIIRDLIADLGSTHAQLPSVRRAYAYLESIEPPFSTTDGN